MGILPMNNQTISLAEVVDVGDATRNGSFQAVIESLNGIPRTVYYVSPYASNSEGAFVAIPQYRSRGVPMQMAFKSPQGAGLLMSEEYTPGPEGVPGYINKKTVLTSSVNKKISLIDSPAIDSIILDSGNNSKITLSNDPKNLTLPAQAIQVESAGPQKYLNTR